MNARHGATEDAVVLREAREAERAASVPAEPRTGGPFGGLSPSEAASRKAALARERRAAEEAAAKEDRMTARQRLATALSLELTVDDWRAVARSAVAQGKVADLARMFDQAYGKSQPEEGDGAGDNELASLSRGERSALIARLLREEEEQRRAAGKEEDPRGGPSGPTASTEAAPGPAGPGLPRAR